MTKRTKPATKNHLNRGDVLSYIASLPLSEGHEVTRNFIRYGNLTPFHQSQMKEFLAKRQEKTPQGGPAGSSTSQGEYHV